MNPEEIIKAIESLDIPFKYEVVTKALIDLGENPSEEAFYKAKASIQLGYLAQAINWEFKK
jgi:heme oxygenase